MIFRKASFSGLSMMCVIWEASGDLPVHCELTDVLGDWKITHGKDPVDSPGVCKPQSGMNPLVTGSEETLVSLTRMFDRSDIGSSDIVLPFVAYSGVRAEGGSWSTIYDEGVVLQIKDPSGSDRLVFYGHFGFSLLDPPSKPSSGALSLRPRSSSISYCNIIPRGWVLRMSKSGEITVHCFTATRISRLLPPDSKDAPIVPPKSLRLVIPDTVPTYFRIPNWDFPRQTASPSQGSCGSCYVLSYAYALERVAINRLKDFGIVPGDSPIQLDREAMLSCSVSNQGCSGGFYSSLTLDLINLGAPPKGCMDSTKAGTGVQSSLTSTAQQCKLSCYEKPDTLIFTRGYAELKTHDEIMFFLLKYGPVPVGIYMSSEHHNSLHSSGRSSGGEIIDLPSIPLGPGMDKLNHGIVIIGWGTDDVSKKPYWEIYNPWGGDDTFAKIARNPDGGVPERNAIGIKVNTCKGLLNSKIRAAGKVPPQDCN